MKKTRGWKTISPACLAAGLFLLLSGCVALPPGTNATWRIDADRGEELLQATLSPDMNNRPVITMIHCPGPATDAGLLPGDLITQIAGLPVNQMSDVDKHLSSLAAGTTTTVTFLRYGGEPKTVPFVLHPRTALMSTLLYYDFSRSENCSMLGIVYYYPHAGRLGRGAYLGSRNVVVFKAFFPFDQEILDRKQGYTPWINYIQMSPLYTRHASGIVPPDLCYGGALPQGVAALPSLDSLFVHKLPQWPTLARPVTVGNRNAWVVPDITTMRRVHNLQNPQGLLITPELRVFSLEVYLAPPSPGAVSPYRVLHLGERRYFSGGPDWSWRKSDSISLYVDGRLWSPQWTVEDNFLKAISFHEIKPSLGDLFTPDRFPFLPAPDLTDFLVSWKEREMDAVLKNASPGDLREAVAKAAILIQQTVETAAQEKDAAQACLEKDQPGADLHRKRALNADMRLPVLEAMQTAMKQELKNRSE